MKGARFAATTMGLMIGIALASLHPLPLPGSLAATLGLIGILICCALWVRQHRTWLPAPRGLLLLMAISSAFVGYWRADLQIRPHGPHTLKAALANLETSDAITLRGTLCAEPDVRSNSQADLRIRVTELLTGTNTSWQAVTPAPILVRVYTVTQSNNETLTRFAELSSIDAYGYTVELEARMSRPRPALNPGEFDYAAFLEQRGLEGRLRTYINRTTILDRTRGNPLVEFALAAKKRFLVTYRKTIRSPASRLVAAATLGTRREVENEVYKGQVVADSFRRAGVGHVLAVSGLHVSVVALLLYSLLRLMRLDPRHFVPVLILALWLFALLTGARPSSVRAAIMNGVILATYTYFPWGLRAASAAGLSISAVAILLHNPLIMLDPSFVLSYGAVLSLIVISPVIDRWITRLRGASLLVLLIWLVALFCVSCIRLDLFLHPAFLALAAALLWAALKLAVHINIRFPAFLRLGADRLPAPIRLFLCGQIAIQLGMMIPLSAWFFGRFPVAGIIVNIAAIPAIAILVQLGLLVGLLGLIPWVGVALAYPFGVADSLVGEGFLALAHWGASTFPFPATPRPSPMGLALYYLVLGVIINTRLWAPRLMTLAYRAWHIAVARHAIRTVSVGVAAAVVLAASIDLRETSSHFRHLTIVAGVDHPVVACTASHGKGTLINAGSERFSDRTLFDTLRTRGIVRIRQLSLTSHYPAIGTSGVEALAAKMPIERLTLPLAIDPAQLMAAIDDSYLDKKLKEGEGWAINYREAMEACISRATTAGMALAAIPGTATEPTLLFRGDNLSATAYPVRPWRSFAERNRTPLISLAYGTHNILIVTDGTRNRFAADLSNGGLPAPDVLVLPDHSRRSRAVATVDTLLDLTPSARVIVFCGDPSAAQIALARKAGRTVFATQTDGAVLATLQTDGTLRLHAYLSGATVSLPRKRPPTATPPTSRFP